MLSRSSRIARRCSCFRYEMFFDTDVAPTTSPPSTLRLVVSTLRARSSSMAHLDTRTASRSPAFRQPTPRAGTAFGQSFSGSVSTAAAQRVAAARSQ